MHQSEHCLSDDPFGQANMTFSQTRLLCLAISWKGIVNPKNIHLHISFDLDEMEKNF
jgi:hypothetical protein